MAYLCAFSSIIFWSTSAAAFKITLRSLNYIPLLFYTAVVSFFIFCFSLLFINGNVFEKKFDMKAFFFSALLGFLNPFLYYFILFKAYSLLSAQKAMALNYTWPLALTLLSIPLLKQRPSRLVLFGMIISFLGVLIIANVWNSPWALNPKEFFGIILALISSFVWALYWILNMKDSRNDRVKLCQNFFWGALYAGIAVKVNNLPFTFDLKGLIGTLYIGTFEMGLTFILWLKALKFSFNTSQVGRLIFITPFISLIFISMIAGEGIQLTSVIGLSLVVLGIIGPNFFEKNR